MDISKISNGAMHVKTWSTDKTVDTDQYGKLRGAASRRRPHPKAFSIAQEQVGVRAGLFDKQIGFQRVDAAVALELAARETSETWGHGNLGNLGSWETWGQVLNLASAKLGTQGENASMSNPSMAEKCLTLAVSSVALGHRRNPPQVDRLQPLRGQQMTAREPNEHIRIDQHRRLNLCAECRRR